MPSIIESDTAAEREIKPVTNSDPSTAAYNGVPSSAQVLFIINHRASGVEFFLSTPPVGILRHGLFNPNWVI
jgi:hypothetical protein